MAAKYIALAGELRRLCARMRQEGRRRLPGESELCRSYGCSRQTVRRALELLAREGLILRLRGSGTYLAGGAARGGRVAVVTQSAEEYVYPRLLREIETQLALAGLSADFYSSENLVARERELLTQLLSAPPAGLLLECARSALPSPNLALLERLAELGVPLVFLRALPAGLEGFPCVREDDAAGAALLVRFLRGKGHEHIAAILRRDDCAGTERYRGFVSALLSSGGTLHERSVLWLDGGDREDVLSADSPLLERFVRERLSPCTAVLCHSDELAHALIRCLLRQGLRVPEDVAVVGFDNSHYCLLGPVPITSLAHERQRPGSAAAGLLLELLKGREAPSVLLPWTLRERESG